MGRSGDSFLVTGASRGVGLSLVKELLKQNDKNIVIGGARSPEKYEELRSLSEHYKSRFHILKLDTSSSQSVKEASERVEKLVPDGLDYLINNAGTSEDIAPPLDTPDEQLASVMQTNAVGPMFMYKHFEHLLSQGQKKTLINTSSNFGSITLASQPLDDKKKRTPLDHTQIVYKASKAAVNMETVVIAHDKRDEGWTIISVHPGVAATDMGNRPQEFGDEFKPECTPEESAQGLVKVILGLTPKDTGSFIAYTGERLPW